MHRRGNSWRRSRPIGFSWTTKAFGAHRPLRPIGTFGISGFKSPPGSVWISWFVCALGKRRSRGATGPLGIKRTLGFKRPRGSVWISWFVRALEAAWTLTVIRTLGRVWVSGFERTLRSVWIPWLIRTLRVKRPLGGERPLRFIGCLGRVWVAGFIRPLAIPRFVRALRLVGALGFVASWFAGRGGHESLSPTLKLGWPRVNS